MTVAAADFVERLRADTALNTQLVEVLELPGSPARYGELDPPLAPPLASALARAGAARLWSHQTAGIAAARAGRDVLVTTPTASGKSLVFHLPVLEAALAGEPGRALFLYPLKALGRDQKVKFDELARAAGLDEGAARCEVYDGDTSLERRALIRQVFPRVVISNPDMLHLGILGSWQKWTPFLRELRWVVLDELHTYRGIFGSHFHHVLRRLTRLCREVGSEPRIIASSATAANAGEFAAELTGRRFDWITESGAPREARRFLLFQPTASPYTLALELLKTLLGAGLKTIVFTKARRITELLYSWLRQQDPRLARRVASYRSGFLPSERRKIERRLFAGELDGVISTSALEMGIDVGGLDACVLVGFPGSVMATWQRAGRVGRADRESVTALVALPDALDQYLLEHPRELVERPCERLVVDPANEPVSGAHLVCAAAERPLSRSADREYLERHAPLVGELLRDRRLVEEFDTGELCSPRRRPHRDVSLRGAGASCTILNSRDGGVIGTVDGVRVLHECHPGAVYLHWGRQFLVRELDLEGGKVHAEPVSVDYFTTPLTEKDTRILEVLDSRRDGALQSFLGRLRVTERVVGYERKRIRGQEALDRHPLDLPPVEFETVGLWWAAPRAIEEALSGADHHYMGSLHAAEHATISLLPLTAICDRGDVGGISIPLHPQLNSGAVFVYDGHPGGVGIAARGYADLTALLGRVTELLESCECESGCPSCVQSPKCGNGNRPLDKAGAARFLRLVLGREETAAEVEPVAVSFEEPAAEVEAPPALREAAAVSSFEDPAAEVEPPSSPPAEAAVVSPGAGAEPLPERPAGAGRGASSERRWRDIRDDLLPGRGEPRRERAGNDPGVASRPLVATESAPGGRGGVARSYPPFPARPRDTVLFDVETVRAAAEVGGWKRAYRMRVAVAVALHLQEGRFAVFPESGVDDLVAMLEAADSVVGFNIRRFDYDVLEGYTGIDYNRRLPTLDLLEDVHRRIGFRVSLNRLAAATLGVEKSADGLKSLEWVREGRLDLVEAYCRRDVEILRDLYLHGRRMGYVLYRDAEGRRFKTEVDW